LEKNEVKPGDTVIKTFRITGKKISPPVHANLNILGEAERIEK